MLCLPGHPFNIFKGQRLQPFPVAVQGVELAGVCQGNVSAASKAQGQDGTVAAGAVVNGVVAKASHH